MHANVLSTGTQDGEVRLLLRRDRLAQFRRLKGGLDTDKAFAERIGMTQGQVSRILRGSAPGPRFIAGVLDLFGIEFFADLFAIVPDDEAA